MVTDLGRIGVEHHEAKFLGADAAEEDVYGAAGGHDAVEERHSPLAGVARTPAVILRTCTKTHDDIQGVASFSEPTVGADASYR